MRSHPRELFRRAHGSAPVVVDAIVADLLTELNSERPRQPVRRRWRFENGFELIGVGRYKRERVADGDTGPPNLLDFGGRLLWGVREVVALSAETVSRRSSGGDGDSETAAGFGSLSGRGTADEWEFRNPV